MRNTFDFLKSKEGLSMKKNCYYHSIIVLLFLPLLLIGCSNSDELTRAKAKELLLNSAEYPKKDIKTIVTEWKRKSVLKGADDYKKALEEYGLGTAKSKTVTFGGAGANTPFRKTDFELTLSEKGKKYIRGNEITKNSSRMGHTKSIPVLVYQIEFGEVTGIRYENEQKTLAIVDYTEESMPTPFAEVEHVNPGKSNQPATVNKNKRFQLYDDGWRVK